jgi:hypothetical protein
MVANRLRGDTGRVQWSGCEARAISSRMSARGGSVGEGRGDRGGASWSEPPWQAPWSRTTSPAITDSTTRVESRVGTLTMYPRAPSPYRRDGRVVVLDIVGDNLHLRILRHKPSVHLEPEWSGGWRSSVRVWGRSPANRAPPLRWRLTDRFDMVHLGERAANPNRIGRSSTTITLDHHATQRRRGMHVCRAAQPKVTARRRARRRVHASW